MYAFEGCMSVIRETEEPEEDMTMKNSCKSSSLQIARPDSWHRASKEPIPQRPNEEMVSPRGAGVMVKIQSMTNMKPQQVQQVQQTAKAQRRLSVKKNEGNSREGSALEQQVRSSGSLLELSQQDSSEASRPANLMQNNQRNAKQPKSMPDRGTAGGIASASSDSSQN